MSPLRAVDYSRYSTDKQRLASIADQQELNRRYIASKGWTHVGSFDDAAAGGENQLRRPGFLRMIADAEAGRFDVLVCEAPDRLARKPSDLSALHDRLTFAKVEMPPLLPISVIVLPFPFFGSTEFAEVESSSQFLRSKQDCEVWNRSVLYTRLDPLAVNQKATRLDRDRHANPVTHERLRSAT